MAPIITASVNPAPNTNGWHRSDATVSFQCDDATSGIATCPSPVVVSTEGAGQVVTGTAVDRAGNQASASVTLNIDKSPPTVTAQPNPLANAAGWNNTAVQVGFDCQDTLSGVATCTAPVTVATEGAGQIVTGSGTDVAGNSAGASVTLNIDQTPPTITAQLSSQPNAAGWFNQAVTVTFNCADTLSGIASCTEPQIISIDGQGQTVTGTALDIAGNTASASVTLNIDTTAPTIQITAPASGAVITTLRPTIELNMADNLALNTASLVLTVNGQSFPGNCTISNGTTNSATASCTPISDLTPGDISLQASVADFAENTANTTTNFRIQNDSDGDGVNDDVDQCPNTPAGEAVDAVGCSASQGDNAPPQLSITSPSDVGLVVQARPVIELAYSDPSGVDTSSLAFELNGLPLSVDCTLGQSRATCTPLSNFPEGGNTLTATLNDTLGNRATTQVVITVDSLPIVINITQPTEGSITQADTADVTGTVNADVTAVEVNGVAATLGGGGFSATVPLREGKNMLVAVATKASGKTGTASVDITRDNTAPIVRIDSPSDGFNSVEDVIAITGLVNDIVDGGIDARVLVNGIEATVADGTFLVMDLPLVRGPNLIEAVATDAVGNVGRHSITVNLQDQAGVRIGVASGNGQAELVNQVLPQSLVVDVKDALGNPVAGRIVTFEVSRNSGLLKANASDPGKRVVQIPSNGSGQASVLFQLGDTAGEGNNRVIATALGVAGEAQFCASSLAAAADKILMVMGDNQRGVVGHPLAQPLEALVVDTDGNPIKGIPVTFTIVRGDGNLDGQTRQVKFTGIDGIARAVYTLGLAPGINNNVVQTTFENIIGLPATFVSSGLVPGNPEDTSFSGVVLDNGFTPIPGAVVSVPEANIETLTNAEGRFVLENVPVGRIHLRIDPTNSPRPETFPLLEFETVTVAGQANILGQPISIPALNTQNSQIVGGDTDVVIKMPDVAGLELTVFANSVTCPPGTPDRSADGTQCRVTISQVHLDKVPMPPAWTVQPAGVSFDPPARISIPNDGLPPGRVIDIFQFDHSLNEFINVGKGTTSEDGLVIISDPGFGITRAGWGGCGLPPPPDTCTRNCPPLNPGECQEIQSATCPACPSLKAADPSKPLSNQVPGNCLKETCGGGEQDDGDLPEDEPTDCVDPICTGPPAPDDGEKPEPGNDCKVCQGGAPQNAQDGGTCSDECGECVGGGCVIADPNKPKSTQVPCDCKTVLCDGSNVDDLNDHEACNPSCQDFNSALCKCELRPAHAGVDYGLCSECGPNGERQQRTSGSCTPRQCWTGDCTAGGCVNQRPDVDHSVSLCFECRGGVFGQKLNADGTPVCGADPCDGFSAPCQECTNVNGAAVISNVDGPIPGSPCSQCSGGVPVNNPGGSCSDGNQCTVGDSCISQSCSPGVFDPNIPGCQVEDDDNSDVTVRLTMFIPMDHVTADIFVPSDQIFTGDNRDFAGNGVDYYDQINQPEPIPSQAGSPTYRIAQEFTYRPSTESIIDRSREKQSGTSQLFDTDSSITTANFCYRKFCPNCSLMFGLIPVLPIPIPIPIPMHVDGACLSTAARTDTTGGDKKLADELADTNSMSVTLVDRNETMAKFKLTGNPANAIVPIFFSQIYLPDGLVPSISWDFFLTIQFVNGKATSWELEGALAPELLKEGHDPFPAYELEIDKKVIYKRDPIPNGNTPLGLGSLPGFRVRLERSGTL